MAAAGLKSETLVLERNLANAQMKPSSSCPLSSPSDSYSSFSHVPFGQTGCLSWSVSPGEFDRIRRSMTHKFPPSSHIRVGTSSQRNLLTLWGGRILVVRSECRSYRPRTLHYFHNRHHRIRITHCSYSLGGDQTRGLCHVDNWRRVCTTVFSLPRFLTLPFVRLVYGTIIAYSAAFREDVSEFD